MTLMDGLMVIVIILLVLAGAAVVTWGIVCMMGFFDDCPDDVELVCDTCGSDNSDSSFAKNEGETCRKFGCFGKMVWRPRK